MTLSRNVKVTLAMVLAWGGPFVLFLLVVSDPGFARLMAYAACFAGPIGAAIWWLRR